MADTSPRHQAEAASSADGNCMSRRSLRIAGLWAQARDRWTS
jgi:hypothetical protein